MQTTGNLGLKKPEGTDIVDITDLNGNMDILDSSVNGKVDKIAGKQLSTNDYTTAEKTKLTGIATGANNYTHPNHTGDVTSTGDGVTAIAAGVIVDADVNVGAGIAWTKLNKTGASLADLTTRSAGDLTSGTLPAARLPGITGDITMAAGTGTAAITAGAVVNADVNAAAAIDATKIGTGVVSNVEFGYLDGVTSGIQAQLNARPLLTTTPQQTTAALTYYVRTDGNDSNTGLANTAGTAFKTLQKAVDMVPKNLRHEVAIVIAAGAYTETVGVNGFTGSGTFTISGAGTCSVNGVDVYYNSVHVVLSGLTGTRTDAAPFNMVKTASVQLYRCNTTTSTASYGYYSETSKVYMSECVASNKGVAIFSGINGEIFAQACTGSGNTVVFRSYYGGEINVSSGFPTGTIITEASEGGCVTTGQGTINPWGDNTQNSRPASRAYASGTVSQALSTAVWTKVQFPQENMDMLGNYDPSLHRFTAPQAGIYQINATVTFLNPTTNAACESYLYINGGGYRRLAYSPASSVSKSISVSGSASVFLYKGDIVEIYAVCESACNLSQGVDSNFEIVRIA